MAWHSKWANMNCKPVFDQHSWRYWLGVARWGNSWGLSPLCRVVPGWNFFRPKPVRHTGGMLNSNKKISSSMKLRAMLMMIGATAGLAAGGAFGQQSPASTDSITTTNAATDTSTPSAAPADNPAPPPPNRAWQKAM